MTPNFWNKFWVILGPEKNLPGFREQISSPEENGNLGSTFFIRKSGNALFCTMGTLGNCHFSRKSSIDLRKVLEFSSQYFLRYVLNIDKFQPSVAYKSVAYKIKSV